MFIETCRHPPAFPSLLSCCCDSSHASQVLLITHELEAPQAATDYFARVLYPVIPLWVFGRSARVVPRCEVKDCLYDGWRDRAHCVSCLVSDSPVRVGVSIILLFQLRINVFLEASRVTFLFIAVGRMDARLCDL